MQVCRNIFKDSCSLFACHNFKSQVIGIRKLCINLKHFKCISQSKYPLKSSNFCNRSNICTTVCLKDQISSLDDGKEEKFEVIYKYPFIVHAKIINRLKIYQTCFSVFLVPVSWGIYFCTDYFNFSIPIACTCASLFAVSMLMCFGHLSQKLIGFMYLNEKQNKLKISHLTFWGKRNDLIISVSEITHLSDIKIHSSSIFINLKVDSPKSDFYFDGRFGTVCNVELFENVFGSINYLPKYKTL